jgi:glycosyltransferase involved in cell wall biosynthesis
MNRKLLIVCYAYAPVLNARAFRWTALAEAFAGGGGRVDVVTAWSPGQPRVEERRGVHVTRVGSRLVGVLRAALGRDRGAPGTGGSGVPGTRGRLASALARAAKAPWRAIAWPDPSALWYFQARAAAARLLDAYRHDALITVGPPFAPLAVGYRLTGAADAPAWLVDLGDPFSFATEAPPNNVRLYRGLNRAFERRVFARAAAVSVTTDATRRRYAEAFPENAAKVWVIPPLLSAPETPVTGGQFFAGEGRLRLLYVGTLYRRIRRPDFLLALFGGLEATPLWPRAELHFVGDVSECLASLTARPELVGAKVFLHGPQPRTAVFEAMREADVLVNIGNDTAYQLPSKVVEYAATGKPIVNIARRDDDSSAAFFARYRLALNLVDGGGAPSESQRARFLEFVSARHAPLAAGEIRVHLEPYGLPAVARAYRELLQEPAR